MSGAEQSSQDALPEGVNSLLDTDLYKLTMQNAVLRWFPDIHVTYAFTNRTPDMQLTREAYEWLQRQIANLANITVSPEELEYLQSTCSYLSKSYLDYMSSFRLRPTEQVKCTFETTTPTTTPSPHDLGQISLHVQGLWVETILYEIPLLALISEAYFKFCDRDWSYDGQTEQAQRKGLALITAGCQFSEFGTRRRRDYHTQELVLQGLCAAKAEAAQQNLPGALTGTSNVHFARQFGLQPIGTVAHEWFMGIAALSGDYEGATERALQTWVATFGKGVLGIALTDTFGTEAFLRSFTLPVQGSEESYAQVFTGVRQDSGDPLEYVKTMQAFYRSQGITERKAIVFSDSLNVDKCVQYKSAAEDAGLAASFGVGTFLTNDFRRMTTGKQSPPMNIVIKLSSAGGNPAVKISDNAGKNTGDAKTVDDVKRKLHYHELQWKDGDEGARWKQP